MNATTNPSERREILQLVRAVVEAHTVGHCLSETVASGVLARRGGAFVTITVDGDLRGCIGHLEQDQPLRDVLRRCAIAASSEDPRFAPLSAEEARRARFEVSLVGPIEVVTDLATIEVGRHGLVAEHRGRHGLLLPQVASEHGWDLHTFLSQTCVKAGLVATTWQSGATISKFEADVFGEDSD